MEGLPYDFGIEDDDDDDKNKEKSSEKKKKDPTSSLIEAIKADIEAEHDKADKEVKEVSHESLFESEEDLDIAPELDAEAPLEHLSRVEHDAIAQTLASERLNEIKEVAEDEITSADLAVESFLEGVQATGDIDEAYQGVITELGEAVIDSVPTTPNYETETALPVDPESLVEQARNELSTRVTHNVPAAETAFTTEPSKDAPKAEEKQPSSRQDKLHSGLVDYVLGRRKGRIKEQASAEVIENKLEAEISDMKLRLAARESHIRELASNKKIDKKLPSIKTERQKDLQPKRTTETSSKEDSGKERAAISAHTMKKSELLEFAAKIEVEGTTLRRMYEGNVIGEKALRRVVAEFLRGGNFKRKLRREIVEKEKDFERDPRLRDHGGRDNLESKSTDLDRLLSKTGINWDEPQPTVQTKKPIKDSLEHLTKDRDNKRTGAPLRRVADVAMITAIVALATVIAVIALSR
jgi:hypothetical protein